MSKKSPRDNYEKYLSTWSGKQLLEDHRLTDTGIWKILGEDPNCDMHGPHHQPDLGIVQGVLEDVIMHGANLPNFWEWGAGGNFVFIGQGIPKIDTDTIAKRQELEEKIASLDAQLKATKAKLKGL